MEFLDSLDSEQRAAATATERRIRCLAGAGSGKTRTLTARVRWLIEHERVDPADILVVTFSKRAADELVHRLGDEAKGVRAGTLHSLGYQVVRSAYPRAKVADEALSRRLIRKAVIDCDRVIEPGKAVGAIPRLKAHGREPEPKTGLRRVWDRHHALLREQHLYDFNDLILVPVELFDIGHAAVAQWIGRWGHVLVDETQDTSATQWAFLEGIVPGTSEDTTVFVVGDVQQGIYSWRGAEPEMMLEELDGLFGPFTTYGIPRNYRSGHRVVGLANRLMQGQVGALTLVPQRELPAEITVLRAEDSQDEARRIVDELQAAHEGGLRWRDAAVLTRTNGQHEALEAACGQAGVPYGVVGGVGFYNRTEVLDVLAYLQLSQGWDHDALDRVYNRPSRYLGHAWKAELEAQGGWGRFESGEFMTWSRSYMVERTLDLRRVVLRLQVKAEDGRGPAELVKWVLGPIGYRAWLLGEEPDDADEVKGEILDALLDAARAYETVPAFLDFAVACQRRGKAGTGRDVLQDRVQLSTVHRCVDPSTLVETPQGLLPIRDLWSEGKIATADGVRDYVGLVSYDDERPMLRITTRCGYTVTVTEDHGLMGWDGEQYAPRVAAQLEPGQFLRLRLGVTAEPAVPALPEAPRDLDVRTVRWRFPKHLTPEVAELFGLIVADGSVYQRGVRLVKRHRDVVERFAGLFEVIFGVPTRWLDPSPGRGQCYGAEAHSTQVAAWLLGIGGMGPRAKAVPAVVLASPIDCQAQFLRGLFEDGTVNVRRGPDGGPRLDHIAFATSYASMATTVQTMLLRLGLISARMQIRGQWRVVLYGAHAKRYAEVAGFVSSWKQSLCDTASVGRETRWPVPVPSSELDRPVSYGQWALQNARSRGTMSRAAATQSVSRWSEEALGFHHDRIVAIERVEGPAMCVHVPEGGRFLQNGFDGCNSKGLEWPLVVVAGFSQGLLPHRMCQGDDAEERRVAYVALTRARDHLILAYHGEPSPYLIELEKAGLIPERGEERVGRVLVAVDKALAATAQLDGEEECG